MSREALVLLVCCCDFRDGAERLIPSKSLRNAVIRAFPGLFRILRMCAPRRAVAVVRPRGREKSADRRRRILISRLLIIRASVPRRKSPFPAYFKGFPAVSPLIPPYPAFLKYPVSPQESCRIRSFFAVFPQVPSVLLTVHAPPGQSCQSSVYGKLPATMSAGSSCASPLQAQKKETAPVREGNPSQTGAASPVVRYAILINAAARPGASAVLIFSAAATRWYG